MPKQCSVVCQSGITENVDENWLSQMCNNKNAIIVHQEMIKLNCHTRVIIYFWWIILHHSCRDINCISFRQTTCLYQGPYFLGWNTSSPVRLGHWSLSCPDWCHAPSNRFTPSLQRHNRNLRLVKGEFLGIFSMFLQKLQEIYGAKIILLLATVKTSIWSRYLLNG